MGDRYATRVAVSILLAFTALVVVLLLGATPELMALGLLIGLVAVLTCPSPP